MIFGKVREAEASTIVARASGAGRVNRGVILGGVRFARRGQLFLHTNDFGKGKS